MKRLTGIILFGAALFLIALPLTAMGANPGQDMQKIRRGLVSDQIFSGVFGEDHGFWSVQAVKTPVQPIMPIAWTNVPGNARRPPFNEGPWAPPPWWTPPKRPPWASPSR